MRRGNITPDHLKQIPIPHGSSWCDADCLWQGEDNLPPECGYHPNFGRINNCSRECPGGWCQHTRQMPGRDHMSWDNKEDKKKDKQRHPTSSTVHLYCVSCLSSYAFVSKYRAVNARLSLRVLPLLSWCIVLGLRIWAILWDLKLKLRRKSTPEWQPGRPTFAT